MDDRYRDDKYDRSEKKEIDNFMQKNDLSKWFIGLYLPIRKVR